MRHARGYAALRGPATAGLRKREWDRAGGQKQKQVKGASNKVPFDGGIDLFFQFLVALMIFEIEGSNSGSDWGAVLGGLTSKEFPFSEKRESGPFMRPLGVSD